MLIRLAKGSLKSELQEVVTRGGYSKLTTEDDDKCECLRHGAR